MGRGHGEAPLQHQQSRTAAFSPPDPGSATVPACFVVCGFRGLIRLPQLLDRIQNVLQEKFGLPVGSSVAYLHMVIGASVCCCKYQIAEGHVSGQALYRTTGLSQCVSSNAFLTTHLFTPILIYYPFYLYTHPFHRFPLEVNAELACLSPKVKVPAHLRPSLSCSVPLQLRRGVSKCRPVPVGLPGSA